jgi:hypothetical protein
MMRDRAVHRRRLEIMLACSLAAVAQRINHVRIPLDESQFESCSYVEKFARGFDPSIPDHVYTL